jgi:hypothetical protein
LNSFLAQCVLNLYSDKISTLLRAKHGTPQDNSEVFITDTGEKHVLADRNGDPFPAKTVPTIDRKVPAGVEFSPEEVLHAMRKLCLPRPPGPEQTPCLTPASELAEGAEFEIVSAGSG